MNIGQNYFHNEDLSEAKRYCSHYFSFGQHYSFNLMDRQAFFIMEASTDQNNFHVIMEAEAKCHTSESYHGYFPQSNETIVCL